MVGIAMMAITGMLVIFVICPIIIFHYLTKLWKSRSLSSDDEQALQQLFLTAQKLEERLINLERVLDIDGNVRK
jgi:phage shock protein B